ncbi:MAG TPA: class III extradiol ring-cleavage dioxygenase [Verrucomicrobiae bacterium]|nr:class III extradiol ring-cleavage dioxygenase [Verrucomicrobiae bacterium]
MNPAGLFVSHGAPSLPLEDSPARHFLEKLGKDLDRPRGIVVMSPHWITAGLTVKSPPRFATWHDFGGFPRELYEMRYEPSGDDALSDRAGALLRESGIGIESAVADARLDHGAWVPLMLMFPKADIPVVQVSLTDASPARQREIGRALRPLASDGVLLLGTGGAVHNLREVEFGVEGAPPDWAAEFDSWITRHIEASDWDALCDWKARAPHALRAHPTDDHFLPLFFASGGGDRAQRLHHSFSHGSLGMACWGFS